MSDLLTKQELAAQWKVSVRTVTRRGPPFIKIGRLPRYSPEAVKAWEVEQAALNEKPRRRGAPGPAFKVSRRSKPQTEAEIDAELRAILRRGKSSS